MQGLALVDYDNVCGHLNKTRADVELRTEDLVDTIAHQFSHEFPELRELDIRLYGGWIEERGLPSPAADWLFHILPVLRGRRRGIIVRPTLAVAMCQFPDLVLRGTVRLQSKRKRQKMVDGMLGSDAVFSVADGATRVGVVTGDDDLIPALLSANAAGAGQIIWMRTRAVGEGLNDKDLIQRGLRVHHCEELTDD